MKHLIISDVQVRPGKDYWFLEAIGNYIVDTKPDVVVCIGDFADMPSLSQYDVGMKSFEGRRYRDDILSTHKAMSTLLSPIEKEKSRLIRNKKRLYSPRMVLTLGNHESRLDRAIEKDRKLEGTLSISDLSYEEFGWEVIPFLKPVKIDGIFYSHYFCSGVMGRAFTSADRMVKVLHSSCVMGHVQDAGICISQKRADGSPLLGLFTGLSTIYSEDYLNPQTNMSLRQIWELNDIRNGFAIPTAIPLDYLIKEYL